MDYVRRRGNSLQLGDDLGNEVEALLPLKAFSL